MFVGAETVAGTGFDAAQARLARLARDGWLAGASGQAFGELDQGLARVGPAQGASRLVEVRVCELVTRGQAAILVLRWEAAGPGGGLFPVLDADITMAPYGESGTLIALAGSYRPQDGWEEHAAFMDRLVDDGFIILGGPVGDGAQTLHAVEAADENEIRVRLARDPWASAGLLRVGPIEPWAFWLDGRP